MIYWRLRGEDEMTQFLDMLKERLADARRRATLTQANLQRAQQEHNLVVQELSSWTNAVAVEMRREQEPDPAEHKNETPTKGTSPVIAVAQDAPESTPEVNKTRLIREVLERYPNGVRPVKVWMELRDQVARPYVYSVLSRMRQRKEAREVRGKYSLLQAVPKGAHGDEDQGISGVN
jgi:hypothetical protein